MLDHSIKLAWVILCTLGAICTWPVLWALAKGTGCWWIPMTFGSALSVAVLSFDLGLIWNLNPSEFPVSFCLTQMFLVNISVFVLCGVTTAWYYAALSAAIWPSVNERALRWRPSFMFLVVVLPIVSTTLQMTFTIKYGAYKQLRYDGTFCDVAEPLWPKLFGYGALPMLLVTPCVVFTACNIPKLQRMNKVHRLIWNDMASEVRFDQPSAPPQAAHLRELSTCSNQAGSGGKPDGHRVGDPSTLHTSIFKHDHGSSNDHSSVDSPAGSSALYTPRTNDGDVSSYGSAPVLAFPDMPPPPPTLLIGQIWRLLLFLFAFFVLCVLLCLPTVLSLIRHRGPREFGADHIAGILASWAVVGIFGTHILRIVGIQISQKTDIDVLPSFFPM